MTAESYNVREDVARAARRSFTCDICGEPIAYEQPFFWDSHVLVHLDCLGQVKETELKMMEESK